MGVTTNSTTMSPIDCAECGIQFNVPQRFRAASYADGRRFYCPNGHSLSWHETEADRLRKQAEQDRKDAELAWNRFREERALHDQEKRSHAATRGHLTRLRKRITAGVCPWCNRNIKQLRQHVASKHPEHAERFAEAEVAARRDNA